MKMSRKQKRKLERYQKEQELKEERKSKNTKFRVREGFLKKIFIASIIVLIMYVAYASFSGPGKYDDFAQCLTDNSVTMYGAEWCHFCKQQKQLFGKSFQFVTYVECPQNQQLCDEKGVEGYPTWITKDNQLYYGVQSREFLSSISGCTL